MANIAIALKIDNYFSAKSVEMNTMTTSANIETSYHDDKTELMIKQTKSIVHFTRGNSLQGRFDAFGHLIRCGNNDINTKHHITFVDQISNKPFCNVCNVESYKKFNKRLIGEVNDEDTIKVCCGRSCFPY